MASTVGYYLPCHFGFWVQFFIKEDTKRVRGAGCADDALFCIYLCGIYINNADQAMFEWGILGKNMYGKEVMLISNRELRIWDILI